MPDLYTNYTDQMYLQLPERFGILPKNKVEIKPVEALREEGASAAAYHQGTPYGSRPGRGWALYAERLGAELGF